MTCRRYASAERIARIVSEATGTELRIGRSKKLMHAKYLAAILWKRHSLEGLTVASVAFGYSSHSGLQNAATTRTLDEIDLPPEVIERVLVMMELEGAIPDCQQEWMSPALKVEQVVRAQDERKRAIRKPINNKVYDPKTGNYYRRTA